MAAGTGGGSSTGSGSGGAGGGCAQLWYCDLDQDGYGDPNVSKIACDAPGSDATCPSSYVASGGDCGPVDQSAHANQMAYFSTPVIQPGPSLAFDYNCDGMVEKDPSQQYKGGMGLTCSFPECFSQPAPHGFGPNAQCGEKAEYYECTGTGGTCMLVMSIPVDVMRCR